MEISKIELTYRPIWCSIWVQIMTLRDFITEAMEIAKELLERGDHEGYQKAMAIIAGTIYEAKVA